MDQVSEFEKSLSDGLSFHELSNRLSIQLDGYFDENDGKKLFDLREGLVLDLPDNALRLDWLRDIEFSYVTRNETPAKVLPDYSYLVRASCVYMAAAQRAYNRKDTEAAWALLIQAKDSCHRFSVINDALLGSKLKYQANLQQVANGGIPGQRVRYTIIALLRQKLVVTLVPGFPDLETALESIHAEMASYIKRTGLKFSLDDLCEKVTDWLREQPAFREEMEEFFPTDQIEYRKKLTPSRRSP